VKRGITVLVLAHGEPAQSKRCKRKKAEEQNGAPEKEIPVEISAFGIERGLVPGRNVHPCVKMVAEEKNWHKEQRQDHQQCREISN
jgi:hypothetical protein